MHRSLLFSALVLTASLGRSQSFVHQVVVLNEGYYDHVGNGGQVVPVTLGSYDPVAGTYQTVATLNGPRFGSDVLVDGNAILVAADDRVYRFDADGYGLLAEAQVQGVRKLAVWQNRLILSRGEVGGLPHYVEVRDKTSLELIATLGPDDGLMYSVEDVLVLGDKAYLAVNNAFDWSNLQGRIGIVDLLTMTYLTEVDLGPDGLNPEKLMEHEGDVIAFNNTDFTGSSISRISGDGGSLIYTTNVSINSGCAASTKVVTNNSIYFLEYAQNELARFDLQTGAVVDTLAGSPSAYGLIEDPINGLLYATTTDFQTSGAMHVMTFDGTVLATTNVGVAPGNLALDVRSNTGVGDLHFPSITVHPNPADDRITIGGALPMEAVIAEIFDATGRRLVEQRIVAGLTPVIHVGWLKPGAYFLRLNGRDAGRFLKQ